MKVHLEAAQDIWLQVTIPDKVTIDSFLEKVEQIEHVIARKKSSSPPPALPTIKEPSSGVDARLNHLEESTQKIISLLDNLQQH
ncbi:MAG: hypothetical protein ACMXYD_01525 [Candidatus Woesearchaeota archaeon]